MSSFPSARVRVAGSRTRSSLKADKSPARSQGLTRLHRPVASACDTGQRPPRLGVGVPKSLDSFKQGYSAAVNPWTSCCLPTPHTSDSRSVTTHLGEFLPLDVRRTAAISIWCRPRWLLYAAKKAETVHITHTSRHHPHPRPLQHHPNSSTVAADLMRVLKPCSWGRCVGGGRT